MIELSVGVSNVMLKKRLKHNTGSSCNLLGELCGLSERNGAKSNKPWSFLTKKERDFKGENKTFEII